mgnify:CR=1 FL=1
MSCALWLLLRVRMGLGFHEVNEKYNFNKAVFPGIQGGPLMHVIAGKAVCLKEALTDEYKEYQKQVVKSGSNKPCNVCHVWHRH